MLLFSFVNILWNTFKSYVPLPVKIPSPDAKYVILLGGGIDKNGKPVKKAVVYTKEEHGIPFEKIDPDAVRVITQLKEYGYTAYIVGGAVRDLLLSKVPHDYDITTSALPEQTIQVCKNQGWKKISGD